MSPILKDVLHCALEILRTWDVYSGKSVSFSHDRGYSDKWQEVLTKYSTTHFFELLLHPKAVNLFVFTRKYQTTDRLLLIHNYKVIYDWKSVHTAHFKNIIRVPSDLSSFSLLLWSEIRFISKTITNSYQELTTICIKLLNIFTYIN